jgi:hypothetical protein
LCGILHACQSRHLGPWRDNLSARGSSAVDPQQETVLAAGMHRLCGRVEKQRGRVGRRMMILFRMFDRAADIRCFGNITRKGAPLKLLRFLQKLSLRWRESHARMMPERDHLARRRYALLSRADRRDLSREPLRRWNNASYGDENCIKVGAEKRGMLSFHACSRNASSRYAFPRFSSLEVTRKCRLAENV